MLKLKGSEQSTPRSPLSVGERNILLWQMEAKPDAFKAAIERWRKEEPFHIRALQLGDIRKPITANNVDFSNYNPRDIEDIAFDGVTFANAIFPNASYASTLIAAGANLENCTVKGQRTVVTSRGVDAEHSSRKAPISARSHSVAVRESQSYGKWAQRGGKA